jgi:hypothetical protein
MAATVTPVQVMWTGIPGDVHIHIPCGIPCGFKYDMIPYLYARIPARILSLLFSSLLFSSLLFFFPVFIVFRPLFRPVPQFDASVHNNVWQRSDMESDLASDIQRCKEPTYNRSKERMNTGQNDGDNNEQQTTLEICNCGTSIDWQRP